MFEQLNNEERGEGIQHFSGARTVKEVGLSHGSVLLFRATHLDAPALSPPVRKGIEAAVAAATTAAAAQKAGVGGSLFAHPSTPPCLVYDSAAATTSIATSQPSYPFSFPTQPALPPLQRQNWASLNPSTAPDATINGGGHNQHYHLTAEAPGAKAAAATAKGESATAALSHAHAATAAAPTAAAVGIRKKSTMRAPRDSNAPGCEGAEAAAAAAAAGVTPLSERIVTKTAETQRRATSMAVVQVH